MKQWMTTSNVLATLAVVLAMTGAGATAYAAIVLTGANVRNETLTGVDVKDYSLSYLDVSSTTQTQLKAMVGPQGFAGPQGVPGRQGSQGVAGPKGPDAARAYSFITAEDKFNLVKPDSTGMVNPDPSWDCTFNHTLPAFLGLPANCAGYNPYFPHWAYDCDHPTTIRFCGLGVNGYGTNGSGATRLESYTQGVVSFSGDENGSFVTLMGAGNIVVNASLSLMRSENDPYTSRVSCQAEARHAASQNTYTRLGVPTVVSASDVYEISHITIAAAGYFTTPGEYDFRVTCRMVDEYDDNDSIDNWTFISGNASATTTEM
ncbi:MAG: hypothetical protein JWM86_450 [Thermoleophilia bacterium]|nr:hypothetical protein [Thermoleophilia bacterium]